jgi:hypothetical protein
MHRRWAVQRWRSEVGQSASIAFLIPGAPSATTIKGAGRRPATRPHPSAVLLRLAHLEADIEQDPLAVCVDPPGADDALLGADGSDR